MLILVTVLARFIRFKNVTGFFISGRPGLIFFYHHRMKTFSDNFLWPPAYRPRLREVHKTLEGRRITARVPLPGTSLFPQHFPPAELKASLAGRSGSLHNPCYD